MACPLPDGLSCHSRHRRIPYCPVIPCGVARSCQHPLARMSCCICRYRWVPSPLLSSAAFGILCGSGMDSLVRVGSDTMPMPVPMPVPMACMPSANANANAVPCGTHARPVGLMSSACGASASMQYRHTLSGVLPVSAQHVLPRAHRLGALHDSPRRQR
jgi:hypothetical protein